jgi:hypothetical protein
MAQKLGILDALLRSSWAERGAINRNAEELQAVGSDVEALRTAMQRQAQDILHLRAMVTGLAEILQAKVAFDAAELEHAVRAAYSNLVPPPKPQPSTDPYRSAPGNEPSPEDIAAARALLKKAEDLHFQKRFQEARELYQQIVDKHGDTKQAAVARQQLENLRGV